MQRPFLRTPFDFMSNFERNQRSKAVSKKSERTRQSLCNSSRKLIDYVFHPDVGLFSKTALSSAKLGRKHVDRGSQFLGPATKS
jgi:hypothetical protein